MARIADFRIDTELEVKGRWVPWRGDIRLLIASSGGTEYEQAVRDVRRKQAVAGVDLDNMPPRQVRALMAPAAAKHLLLGWENMEAEDGVPMAYSEAGARKLLADPAYYHLLDFVLAQSTFIDQYLAKQAASAEGD